MHAIALLTGPEVVGVVRDVVVIAFLVFAFLALAVFVTLALLLYRRLAALLDATTAAVEHGDRVLEDFDRIVTLARTGGSIPGQLARSAFAAVGAVFGSLVRRRRPGSSDDRDRA